jgi:dTDP-4-dehydrorhamnose 3,5-epimerase
VETAIDISDVVLSELQVHDDQRGSFAELMRARAFPEPFVQSNHSRSAAGVLRGLHYHRRQADLWYVVRGRALCGLVDLRERREPPVARTVLLDEATPRTLYIPPGVAHGYVALTELDLIYWVTQEYDASDEHGIAWDDPNLGLDWGIQDPVLSPRDQGNPPLDWAEIRLA